MTLHNGRAGAAVHLVSDFLQGPLTMTFPAALFFDVFISEDGLALVNGESMAAEEGVTVHEAVLNLLHRHAHERDAAVRAAVNDGSVGEHFLLDVLPDGSSRLHTPPDDELLTPPAADGVRTDTELPAALAVRVAVIQQHAVAGQIDLALPLATALREHLTDSWEATHPYALEARALEAYLAHLNGNPRQATLLALVVARVSCQNADAHTADDVARATAAWSRLREAQPVAAHGSELLNMWQRLDDQGLVSHAHTALAGYVRQRMGTFRTRPVRDS